MHNRSIIAGTALLLATTIGLADTAMASEPVPLTDAQLEKVTAGFFDLSLFTRGAIMPLPGGMVGSFSGGTSGGGGVSVTPLPGGWTATSTAWSRGDGGGASALSFSSGGRALPPPPPPPPAVPPALSS